MTGRERIQAAFGGVEPDRIPCSLAVYPVRVEELGDEAAAWAHLLDVQFVHLPPSPEDAALRATGYAHPADTRLGTPRQLAGYARWRYHPEDRARANPLSLVSSLRELREFPFPDPATPYQARGLEGEVAALHDRGLAVGGCLPHLGGELLESGWRLRGLENFLLDLLERPAWARFLLDRLTELGCRNAAALARGGVDILLLGDDVGMPGGMMVGPGTWRRFFKPRLERIIASARQVNPRIRVVYHSDGHVEPIVDGLMEIGVEALNPVQPEYMDAARLRRRYGPRLLLWGTVGSQGAFSAAQPEAIRSEVRRRVRELGRTALVLCPAYDIDEPDTRAENIAAFLRAVSELG